MVAYFESAGSASRSFIGNRSFRNCTVHCIRSCRSCTRRLSGTSSGLFPREAALGFAAVTAAMLDAIVVLAGDSAIPNGQKQGHVGVDTERVNDGSNPPLEHEAPYQIDATPDRSEQSRIFVESGSAIDADRRKEQPAEVLGNQHPKF